MERWCCMNNGGRNDLGLAYSVCLGSLCVNGFLKPMLICSTTWQHS